MLKEEVSPDIISKYGSKTRVTWGANPERNAQMPLLFENYAESPHWGRLI